MDQSEIVRSYREAKNKEKQIQIFENILFFFIRFAVYTHYCVLNHDTPNIVISPLIILWYQINGIVFQAVIAVYPGVVYRLMCGFIIYQNM